MKTYLITSGSFRMDDGTERGVGAPIELADDVAKACAHQLQEVPPEAVESAENSGADDVAKA